MYITYSQAISNPNRVIILEGKNAENFAAKDKKNKFRADKIRKKVPMNFMKINNILHGELNEIEYMDFWNEIKIKEINEV